MKYSELVEVYRKLEATSKRLEKTHHLSEFLKKTGASDIEEVMLLLTGRVFPAWDERKIGVASRMMIKALAKATGDSPDSVEKSWKKTGDLGDTAELLISKKKQRTLFSSELTVSKVFNNIQKLAEMTGEGTVEKKAQLIAELLTSAKPIEAKYITRTVLEELRVGLGDGTIRDAIVWAFFSKEIGLKYDEKENDLVLPENSREVFNKYINLVQSAYDVANDFAAVAKTIREKGEKGLEKTGLTAGRPVKVMLAQKVKDVKEGFETVGKPAALEFKYDGVRMQIHRKDPSVVRNARVKMTPGKSKTASRADRGRKAVLSPDRHLAAFDLENTLIASNVVESFSFLATRDMDAAERARFTLDMLRQAPAMLKLDRKDHGDFLRSFYRRYEDAPSALLREDAWEYLNELVLMKSFPAGIRRVREHRALGHRTILITGALDFLVEPLRPLFDEIVAARMTVGPSGGFTGELDVSPPTGEARAMVLARYAEAEGLLLEESVSYADSASDLPDAGGGGPPRRREPRGQAGHHRPQAWLARGALVEGPGRTAAPAPHRPPLPHPDTGVDRRPSGSDPMQGAPVRTVGPRFAAARAAAVLASVPPLPLVR